MARRRMFSLDIVDTDRFLEMPATSQNLYFHLGMRADDDGFVDNPRRITKLVNCGEDDLRVLVSRGYVIAFQNGVVVIRHWQQNNYIKADRYKKTLYAEQKAALAMNNGVYMLPGETCAESAPVISDSAVWDVPGGTEPEITPQTRETGPETIPDKTECLQTVSKLDTECFQNGSKLDTQVRLGKDSIDKSNKKHYSVCFEQLWSAYPRKKEKARAYKCYKARLNDGYSEDELLGAVKQYAEECRVRKTEERFIKHPATFLGPNMPFTDYLRKEVVKDDPESTEESSLRLW